MPCSALPCRSCARLKMRKKPKATLKKLIAFVMILALAVPSSLFLSGADDSSNLLFKDHVTMTGIPDTWKFCEKVGENYVPVAGPIDLNTVGSNTYYLICNFDILLGDLGGANQAAAIKVLIDVDQNEKFYIDITDGINFTVPQSMDIIATLSQEGGGGDVPVKFGELHVEPNNVAYVTFCGDYWNDGGYWTTHQINGAFVSITCTVDVQYIAENGLEYIQLPGGGELTVTIPQTPPLEDPDIDKSGEYNASENVFDWTVSVTPNGNAYKYPIKLTDTLTGYHELKAGSVKAWFVGADNVPKEVTLSPGSITIAGSKHTVNIAKTDIDAFLVRNPEYDVKTDTLVITYKTSLTSAFWTTNGITTDTVSNDVELELNEDYTLSADAEVDTPDLKPTVTKRIKGYNAGDTITSTGKYLEWEIVIDTHGQPLETLELYDLISTGLTLDDSSIKVYGPSGASTALVACDNVHNGKDYCFNGTASLNPAYSFTIEFHKTNGSSFYSTYKITYRTNVNEDEFDGSKGFADLPITNEAWLEYSWPVGHGGGIAPITSPSLTIGAKYDTSIVRKSGKHLHTDAAIEWTVTLNPYHADVTSGTYTDTLPAGVLPNTDRDSYTITVTLHPSGDAAGKTAEQIAALIRSGLTFGVANGKNTISFDAAILGKHSVKIVFITKLDDANLVYQSNSAGKITAQGSFLNTIDFSGKIGASQTNVTDSATANPTIDYEMLSKTGSTYDHLTHKITWTITVNKDNLNPVNNVIITDTLPQGLSFDSISVKSGQDKIVGYYPQSGVSYSLSADKRVITITLGKITGQVELEIVSLVDVDHEAFGDKFEQGKKITVTNNVSMSNHLCNNVTCSASKDIQPAKPLLKTGTPRLSVAKIDYVVKINTEKLELMANGRTEFKLIDTMSPGLSLDLSSVKLFYGVVTSNGTMTKDEPVAQSLWSWSLSDDPLSGASMLVLTVKTGNPCILEYTCDHIGSEGYSFTNTIEFEGSRITCTETPDAITSYYIAAGGGMLSLIAADLEVVKTDSGREPLEGITFILWASVGDQKIKIGEKTTDANGKLVFKAVRFGYTYQIEEIEVGNELAKFTRGGATIKVGDAQQLLTIFSFNFSSSSPKTLEITNHYPGGDAVIEEPSGGGGDEKDDKKEEDKPTDGSENIDKDDEDDGSIPDGNEDGDGEEPYTPGPSPTIEPPTPSVETSTLIPTADGGYEELDEDGVPLGKWTYDEEEEVWIFEPYPLANIPPTGVSESLPLWILAVPAASAAAVVFSKRKEKE